MKRISLLCVAMLLASGVASVQSAEIGRATVVKNRVTGQMGARLRTLRRGNDIFQHEMIAAAPRSLARLTFLDKTRLTIGANSRVRLTSFIFNPDRRRGRMVLNALKGAFRFVSGLQPSSAYRLRTPLASISVRGTAIDGYIERRHRFDLIILRRGGMTVCAPSHCLSTNRPGTYILVKANGNIATGHWHGKLQPLFGKHMYKFFPARKPAIIKAVLRDFRQTFGSLR
jgi:hypothetical protein